MTTWLSLALVANVAAGLAWSPATGLRRVRVVGVTPGDEQRVETHLQVARRIPALRFDPNRLESLIQARSDVESASFSQNLFGRGVLRITPRTPVARLEGTVPMWLSSTGVLYSGPAPRGAKELPRLRLSAEAREANLSLAGAWDAGRIAQLCTDLRKDFAGIVWTVERDGRGVISLSNGSGARVVLGTSEALQDKVGTLRRILEMQPGILSEVRELNLTAPNNPAAIPLGPSP